MIVYTHIVFTLACACFCTISEVEDDIMMEAIKTFEVDVDLTEVDTLYDYARCEYIHRQPGTHWDLQALRTRAQDDQVEWESEILQARITMMDKILMDAGYFEKSIGQNINTDTRSKCNDKGKQIRNEKESEKDDQDEVSEQKETTDQEYLCTEDMDNVYVGSLNKMQPLQLIPKRVLPIYKPGDTVRGNVILELTDIIEAEKVKLKFTGHAVVRLFVSSGQSQEDCGEEIYVDKEDVFWERSDDRCVNENSSLLDKEDRTVSTYIPAGKHTYPFVYVIPTDVQGSIPDMVNGISGSGFIAYHLKATIDKGRTWRRGNIISCRGIWVDNALDFAHHPDNLTPVTCEESLDTGFLMNRGKVVLRATIPRRIYVRGETIPVALQVENTNKCPIDTIISRTRLHGKIRTSSNRFKTSRTLSVKGKKVESEAVSADTIDHVNLDVPLDFSNSYLDSNLIPVGSLNDCSLIDVRYEVHIKAKRKGVHRDIELKIPIILGADNSHKSKSDT